MDYREILGEDDKEADRVVFPKVSEYHEYFRDDELNGNVIYLDGNFDAITLEAFAQFLNMQEKNIEKDNGSI
jgi:hypothetical protein